MLHTVVSVADARYPGVLLQGSATTAVHASNETDPVALLGADAGHAMQLARDEPPYEGSHVPTGHEVHCVEPMAQQVDRWRNMESLE